MHRVAILTFEERARTSRCRRSVPRRCSLHAGLRKGSNVGFTSARIPSSTCVIAVATPSSRVKTEVEVTGTRQRRPPRGHLTRSCHPVGQQRESVTFHAPRLGDPKGMLSTAGTQGLGEQLANTGTELDEGREGEPRAQHDRSMLPGVPTPPRSVGKWLATKGVNTHGRRDLEGLATAVAADHIDTEATRPQPRVATATSPPRAVTTRRITIFQTTKVAG
jgi:hypothetical protein